MEAYHNPVLLQESVDALLDNGRSGSVVKNANNYFDEQLVSCVESMTKQANIVTYKSNQRTFRDDEWRYAAKPKDLDCYSLDYRVVISCGGLSQGYRSVNGLSQRAAEFINDLCAIASNIAFEYCMPFVY